MMIFFSIVKESFRYTGVGFAGHCICAVQWETYMVLVLWNDFSCLRIRKDWELLFEFIVLHWNIKYGYYSLFQIWMTVHSIQVDKLTEVVFCVLVMLCTVFCASNPSMCGTAAPLVPGLPQKVPPFFPVPSSSLPSQASLRVSQRQIFCGLRLSISCPTLNVEDQDIRLHLGHCLWPVCHGRPC